MNLGCRAACGFQKRVCRFLCLGMSRITGTKYKRHSVINAPGTSLYIKQNAAINSV